MRRRRPHIFNAGSLKSATMWVHMKVLDLLIVLVIAFLLFGTKRIPEVAKGLGEGIRNFKSVFKSDDEKPEEKPEEKKQP